MAFRRRNILFSFFLMAYAIVALLGNLNSPVREVFPVFSWSLFSYVPASGRRLELVVTEIDRQQFDPPAHYYELTEHFRAARTRNSTLLKALGRLFLAIESGDSSLLYSIRRTFERNYFFDQSKVRYQIVITQADPLERWRGEAPEIVNVIAEFSTDE